MLSNGNTSKISHLIKAYCPGVWTKNQTNTTGTKVNHHVIEITSTYSQRSSQNKGVRPERSSVYLLDNHDVPGHFHTLGHEVQRQVTFSPAGEETNSLVGGNSPLCLKPRSSKPTWLLARHGEIKD